MLKYVVSTLLFCISLMSFGAEFVAGKDYEILKKVSNTDMTNSTVSVTEYFSFGCPWCFRLEPALDAWVKQQQTKINFNKTPVVFNKDWEYYAKAYYAANALSLNSTLNPALFKAILQDKRSLNNNKAMIDFFIQHGVNAETANSAFTHSPSIELSVKAGMSAMTRDHINAVPAFVVNNQFKTDLQMAKTEKRLFALLNFLIAQSKMQQASQ